MKAVIVMGVAGSGKSTVGRAIAQALDYEFADADDFHPAENRAKMTAGTPLTDEDRLPWLAEVRRYIERRIAAGAGVVVACSALKNKYRELLTPPGDEDAVRFVYLKATRELTAARLKQRQHHFMKANMIESQFATLEAPSADEALVVDASEPVDRIVGRVVEQLRNH